MSSTEDTVLVALGPDANIYRLPKTLISPYNKALVERDGWCTNAVTNRPEKTVVLCYVPQLLDFHGSDTPVVDLCLQVDEYPVYAWGGVSKLIAASIAAEREFTGLEKATVSLKSAASSDTLAPPKTLCSSCQHEIDCGAKGMQDPFEDQAGYEADTVSHETMIPAYKNKTEIAEMAQTLLDLDDFKLHLASLTSRIEGLLPAWISVKLAEIERGTTFVEKGIDALDLGVTRAYVDTATDAVDIKPPTVSAPELVLELVYAPEHEADSSALIGSSASYWDLREDAPLFNDEHSAEQSYWNLNDPVVLPPMDEAVVEEAVISEPNVNSSPIPLAVEPSDAPIEAHISLSRPLVEVNPEEAVISEPATPEASIPKPSITTSPSPIPPTASPEPTPALIQQEQEPCPTLSPALSFECGLSDCRTRHGPALMALKARQEAEMRAYAVVWEKEAEREREREDKIRPTMATSAGAEGDTLVDSAAVPVAVGAMKKVLPPPSSPRFKWGIDDSRAGRGGVGWPGIHAVLAAVVVESSLHRPVEVKVEVDWEERSEVHLKARDEDGPQMVDGGGEEEEEEEEASCDVDGGSEEQPEDELGVVAEDDDKHGWETEEYEEVVDDDDDDGDGEEEEEEDASYDGDDESADLDAGLNDDEDGDGDDVGMELELERLESDVEDVSYEGDDESREDCEEILEEAEEAFDGEGDHPDDEDHQEQAALGIAPEEAAQTINDTNVEAELAQSCSIKADETSTAQLFDSTLGDAALGDGVRDEEVVCSGFGVRDDPKRQPEAGKRNYPEGQDGTSTENEEEPELDDVRVGVGLHEDILETEAKHFPLDTEAGPTLADIASFNDLCNVGMNTFVLEDLLAVYKDIEDATGEMVEEEIQQPTSSDLAEPRDDSLLFEYVEGVLGVEEAVNAEAARPGVAGEEHVDDGLDLCDESYSFKVDEGSVPLVIPEEAMLDTTNLRKLVDEEQADNCVDALVDPCRLVEGAHAQLEARRGTIDVEKAPETRGEERVDDGGGSGGRPYNLGTPGYVEQQSDAAIGSLEECIPEAADEGISIGQEAHDLRPVAQITQVPNPLKSAFGDVFRDIPNVSFGRSVGEREELSTELAHSASALGKGRETESLAPPTPERPKTRRPVSTPTPPPLTTSPSASTLLDVKKRRGVSAIFGFTPSSPELMSRRDSLARVNGRTQPQSPSKRGFQLPKLKGTGRLLNGSWKPPTVASSSTPKNSPAAALWGTAVRSVRFPGRDKTNEVGTPTPSRGNDANLTLLMPKAVSAHFYLKKRG